MAGDIIDLIVQDHQEVRGLLARVDDTEPGELRDLFHEVVHELARHEAAEEAIVHRALRDHTGEGQEVAEAVLEEESEAERLMADMEKMDPTSDEFIVSFRRLKHAVLDHAEHEEQEEHLRLRAAFTPQELAEMGEKFERTKELAPTRPHPMTPQTPEVRAAAGPIAGVFDRMRDKVRELLGG